MAKPLPHQQHWPLLLSPSPTSLSTGQGSHKQATALFGPKQSDSMGCPLSAHLLLMFPCCPHSCLRALARAMLAAGNVRPP